MRAYLIGSGSTVARPFTVISPRAPFPAQVPRAPNWRDSSSQPAVVPQAAWSPRTGADPVPAPDKNSALIQTAGTIALTSAVLLLGNAMRDRLASLGDWTYPAVALAEFMDAATPFIPTPVHAFIYFAASQWNPLVVAMAAAIGSTIGETVGYLTGCRGQQALRGSRMLRTCAAWFGRWEGRVIIGLAAIPFPIYLAGIWAGALGVSYRRFFAYALAGKLVLFGTLSMMGFFQR